MDLFSGREVIHKVIGVVGNNIQAQPVDNSICWSFLGGGNTSFLGEIRGPKKITT